jgi:hypothetical protein
MDQGEALEDRGSLGEGLLSGAEQGEQFIQSSRAAAGRELELGIQRGKAVVTEGAKVVGSLNGDGAEDGGDFGRSETLVASRVSAGAGEGGKRLGRSGEGAKASKESRAEFLERRRRWCSRSVRV